MKNVNVFFFTVFIVIILSTKSFAGNLINLADYEYWRDLTTSPSIFKSMKHDALNNQSDTSLDVLGASALAYILDGKNKNQYITAIKKELDHRITNIRIGKGAGTSSVPSHLLFHALIALDVIADDISPAERKRYERMLKTKIFSLYTKKWRPHAIAMRMMWYKYSGDMTAFNAEKIQYDFESEDANFLKDGVCKSQNGYCMERFNSKERAAKNQVFDLLEYMGYNDYYSWPALQKSYEYIYGLANAPFGRAIFYGDSRGSQTAWDVKGQEILSPTSVRASRFSINAYKWSMWALKEGAGLTNPVLKGYLASYIIMAGSAEKNSPIEFDINDAELAPSKVLTNYALLVGNNQSRNALYASIMSLDGVDDYHTHNEANALAMGGYGEHILRNAGYDGPGKAVSAEGITTSYQFLARNAESANTLMIGGKNHSERHGNGMLESIVGTDIEYVRALNNRAIAGVHNRDLLFMQAADGVNGYYLVMDHVTTDVANQNINVMWHPNTEKTKTIESNKEYYAQIKVKKGAAGPVLFSWDKGQRVDAKIFMATPPNKVDKKEMVNQSRGHHYRAEYLYTTYPTNNSRADILTVLFPGDQEHDIGNMKRLKFEGFTGSTITQGKVVDTALISDGLHSASKEDVSFLAEDVVYRHISGKLTAYFVKGKSFRDGDIGFASPKNVAVYLKGNEGKVISPGTHLTLYAPTIEAVKLNDRVVSHINAGENWLTISIPKGSHTIELITQHSVK
jgi:hypothetical protein